MSLHSHTEQHTPHHTGLEFIEGFALLAGVLWMLGALAVGSVVLINGQQPTTTDSNETPIAESNNTPTTEAVQTVDTTAAEAPEGETAVQP